MRPPPKHLLSYVDAGKHVPYPKVADRLGLLVSFGAVPLCRAILESK